MSFIDQAKDIRKGEELDVQKLEEYLSDTIEDVEGEIVLKQFPGGSSNLTYLVTAGNTELILRRPPHGKKAKSAHDMGREYRMLSALKPVYPYCPTPLVYCEDTEVMDAPFYIMERIRGIIPRKNFPKGMELSHEQAKKLCENFVDVWAQLHSLDYNKIGLSDFGKPEGYVKRQVDGWIERYKKARTPDAPESESVMSWLEENMPADSENPCIIHNDFKLDNVVLDPEDPTKIIGILDWEMTTIGDPLMDIGSGLGYWVNSDDPEIMVMSRMLPTTEPGMFSREEIVARYCEKTGRKIENFNYYLCFGIFRLAVIAQQIYYRYYHGQTQDERFKLYIIGVQVLEEVARTLIEV